MVRITISSNLNLPGRFGLKGCKASSHKGFLEDYKISERIKVSTVLWSELDPFLGRHCTALYSTPGIKDKFAKNVKSVDQCPKDCSIRTSWAADRYLPFW